MAGAYCRFCDHRCFVLRVLPDQSWSGHMATCAQGMAHDRQVTGHDHTTALNPLVDLAFRAPELRGCLVDGYDDQRANEVLGRISRLCGVDLICVWDIYDESGVGGNSQFYLRSRGRIHELGGELWRWLNEDPDGPDCPPGSGDPDTWLGAVAEFTDDDLPWDDSWRNYAHRDIHTPDPEFEPAPS